MYTKQALRELGVTGREFTEAQRQSLDDQGFFVVTDIFSAAQCRAMAEEFDVLHRREGDRGGHEVHVEPGAPRVSDILNKTSAYDCCLEIKPLLAAAHYILGEFKLHGANLRDPLPGKGHQDLHVDVPKLFDDDWWVLNAIVTFDDMTADNGPTRIVPGSHKWHPINVPYVNQGDWEPAPLTAEQAARTPGDLAAPYPGELHVVAPRGSVIIVNSSMWHGGTTNRSGARRRVLHLTYTRRDLPQQLVQRDYLTPGLYDRMSPAQRFLLDIEESPAEARARRSARKAGVAGDHWWAEARH
jgi:ectoine hydroxylase-related dioxygenase (phytanoyl-CoA dioxygenase family)